MHVSVIGAGYVGLVTAACLADVGNVVLCIDIDAAKIERLRRSEIPIHEPGLDRLVERNAAAGRLQIFDQLRRCGSACDADFYRGRNAVGRGRVGRFVARHRVRAANSVSGSSATR